MRLHLPLLSAVAVLAACGGGGGGDARPPDDTAMALGEANYVAVSREAISPASYLFDTSSLSPILGAQVGSTSAGSTNVIFGFSRAQVPRVSGWFASAPVQITGVTQSQIVPCDGGGTLTITGTDVNGNQVADPGDSVQLSASDCLFEGSVINGDLTIVVDSVSGTIGVFPFAFSMNFILDAFTVQSGDGVDTATGSFSLASNASSYASATNSIDVSVLSMSSTYAGETVERTLSNYMLTETIDLETSTVLVDGGVDTSVLRANALLVQTLTPVTIVGEADPLSGQLVVRAALGGKIRITALTGGAAFVELDANDDGVYETSTTLPWSELI